MADTATTLFTLPKTADKILALVEGISGERTIIINAVNVNTKAIGDLAAALEALIKALTSQIDAVNASLANQIAGTASKIDAVDADLTNQIAGVQTEFAGLNSNVTNRATDVAAKIGSLVTQVTNLLELVEAMLQALQGVATSDLQQQEIELLNEIVADVDPHQRPVQIAGDPASISVLPQPLPPS
jgi:hypothetical protein